jgi:predicted aspartyl protease
MPRNWAAFRPNGLPILATRVRINRFSALVDTGAVWSLITPTVATGLGLQVVGTDLIIGVTGVATTVPLVEVIGVSIGDIELPPFQAGVLELSHLRFGMQIVLGVTACTSRRLQIDFGEGRVYLPS